MTCAKCAEYEVRIGALEEALRQCRGGVMLMVPEPQKSGFLRIIDPALALSAPAQPEKETR